MKSVSVTMHEVRYSWGGYTYVKICYLPIDTRWELFNLSP